MSNELLEKLTTDRSRSQMRIGAHKPQKLVIETALDATENEWLHFKYKGDLSRSIKAIEREENIIKALDEEITKMKQKPKGAK